MEVGVSLTPLSCSGSLGIGPLVFALKSGLLSEPSDASDVAGAKAR